MKYTFFLPHNLGLLEVLSIYHTRLIKRNRLLMQDSIGESSTTVLCDYKTKNLVTKLPTKKKNTTVLLLITGAN